MWKNRKIKFFLFSLLNFLYLVNLMAAEFTASDAGKIVFRKNSRAFQQEERFLVVDEVRANGTLLCHYFGQKQQITIPMSDCLDTALYEGCSSFQITQYAFFAYVKRHSPNAYLELAEICGDTTNRMNKFAEFQRMNSRFLAEMNTIKKSYYLDQYDRLDDLFTLLENSAIPEFIIDSTLDGDWILSIAMSEGYHHTLENLRRLSKDQDFQNEIQQHLADLEMALTERFSERLAMNNPRKNIFLKLFPKATGLWQRSAPKSYREIIDIFFTKSIISFIKLNKLSYIINPQEWGSAILDVLLLTGNTPGVLELERTFDLQIRAWEKNPPADNPAEL